MKITWKTKIFNRQKKKKKYCTQQKKIYAIKILCQKRKLRKSIHNLIAEGNAVELQHKIRIVGKFLLNVSNKTEHKSAAKI